MERGRLLSWVVRPHARRHRRRNGWANRLEKCDKKAPADETALAQMPAEDTLRLTIAEVNDAHKNLGAAEQEARTIEES